MSEKSNEEFQNLIDTRDDWSRKCDMYSMEISKLEQKIERLTRAGQKMAASQGDVGELIYRLQGLPDRCAGWKGSRADDNFRSCAQGDLFRAYEDYRGRLESVLQSIEAARNHLSLRLETVQSSYLEARSNYVCWANRAAWYWK